MNALEETAPSPLPPAGRNAPDLKEAPKAFFEGLRGVLAPHEVKRLERALREAGRPRPLLEAARNEG